MLELSVVDSEEDAEELEGWEVEDSRELEES